MSTTRSRLESRKPPKVVTRPWRRRPSAKDQAPARETVRTTSESAFGCTRGWNRNGRARAMRSSKSWPKRAFSTARGSAPLRGGLLSAARHVGRVDEVGLGRYVGEGGDLALDLLLPDPAASADQAAVETQQLLGGILHG